MSARQSSSQLLTLLVATAAVVALLTWLWGWALPVVLFLVVVMVMGHEFGHFITAKRAGMKVTDFFVGFGPVLWSTTRGETRYGIRALLLGGYVKVPGMTWFDKIEPEAEKRTYRSASYPRKVLFASAGSLMHVVMALLIAYAALVFVGHPDNATAAIGSFSKWPGHAQTAGQVAGLRPGDVIVAVDSQRVSGAPRLTYDGQRVDALTYVGDVIHAHAGRTLTIVVRRAGRLVTLRATPVDGRSLIAGGAPLVKAAVPVGLLGIYLVAPTVHTPWYRAIPDSATLVISTINQAAHALVHVFSPGEFTNLFHQVTTPALAQAKSSQTTRPVSIIGVVRIADQAARANLPVFFSILITLNIFVGVMNMLPMLPLDGGYVAIATYERLRRRGKVPYQADINKLTPVVVAFVGILLILFASTLYLDIAYPITNPFH